MTEYLYDAIVTSSGEDVSVAAEITDEEEQAITENCSLLLFADDNVIFTSIGSYNEEENQWEFEIPASVIETLKGRYAYAIKHEGQSLQFKQPIYFI